MLYYGNEQCLPYTEELNIDEPICMQEKVELPERLMSPIQS